ncbi:hypothetical protein K7432_015766 [Basidiobolus ranarum]|uniref:Uncharacterized protein n=1 Tax=Basidiobolus ranarum TaxID=34480 RepID=A0ABR2VMN2_9FUNG
MFIKIFTLTTACALSTMVAAHMEMTNPAPRESKFNPNYKDGQINYDMTSPLDSQVMNLSLPWLWSRS